MTDFNFREENVEYLNKYFFLLQKFLMKKKFGPTIIVLSSQLWRSLYLDKVSMLFISFFLFVEVKKLFLHSWWTMNLLPRGIKHFSGQGHIHLAKRGGGARVGRVVPAPQDLNKMETAERKYFQNSESAPTTKSWRGQYTYILRPCP